MTRQEAIAALSDRFTYADEATFTLRYEGRTWDFSAASKDPFPPNGLATHWRFLDFRAGISWRCACRLR
jgi:hypothetical protein